MVADLTEALPVPDDVAAAASWWRLTETAPGPSGPTARIWFAMLAGQPVVIKSHIDARDALQEAGCLRQFAAARSVELIELHGNTLLLERVRPGTSLRTLVDSGRDDDATIALCEVAATLHASPVNESFPAVEDMLTAFDGAADIPSVVIPRELIKAGRLVYRELAESQSRRCLLHGDLHHDNVLAGDDWIAIDPKGVIGEREFEFGACLRNPAFRATTTRAIRQSSVIADLLALDRDRIYAWGFAQAVVAAIWAVEDGLRPDFALHAAEAMRRAPDRSV